MTGNTANILTSTKKTSNVQNINLGYYCKFMIYVNCQYIPSKISKKVLMKILENICKLGQFKIYCVRCLVKSQ